MERRAFVNAIDLESKIASIDIKNYKLQSKIGDLSFSLRNRLIMNITNE